MQLFRMFPQEANQELLDARYELEIAIRGHDHESIYGWLKQVASLSDALIEDVFCARRAIGV